MRIICPNCDAHYEIEASAIPPGGRDVQCSACGHGWFQASAQPAPAAVFDGLPEEEDEAADAFAAAEAEAAERPEIDPALRAILREEAEREAIARRSEAGQPDSLAEGAQAAVAAAPAEPAVATIPPAADAAPADAAALEDAEELHFRPLEADAAAGGEAVSAMVSDAAVSAVPGRQTLRDGAAAGPEPEASPEPDAGPKTDAGPEMAAGSGASDGAAGVVPLPVASRGRSGAAAGDAAARVPAQESTGPAAVAASEVAAVEDQIARRRGFRMGFIGMLLVAGGAIWLYVYGRGLPDAGPMLTSYVALMDGWRIALVQRLDAVVDALVQMTVGS